MKSLTGVSTGARPRRPTDDRHTQVRMMYRMARRKARSSSNRSSRLAPSNNTLAKSVLYSWVNMAGTEISRMIRTNTDTNWWLKP
ncbi:hypothetical protein D3C71_2097170 [compost metagenome]